MKKCIVKEIRKIAVQLPIVMSNTHEYHQMTGAQILEQTEFKDFQGKPINPELSYLVPMPVQIAVNHETQLKRMYKEFGLQGIKNYSETVIAAHVAASI